VARCAGCGLELTTPRPDDAALAAFYRASDYTAHEPVDDGAARARARTQLDRIAAAGGAIAGARVLDLGCGGGQLLALARDRGADGLGVDPAPHAHAAGARQGLAIVDDLAAVASASVDGAVVSHVLEHVPDLAATIGELARVVRPGGWLCVEVPNLGSLRARLAVPALIARGADERHRAFPIHLWYFTSATLARALGASGFELSGVRDHRARRRRADPAPRAAARRRPPRRAPERTRPPPPPRRRVDPGAAIYLAARDAFHRARLGENLIAVAIRRAAPSV
jgi:SAM-dependent methyltransferase